MRSITALLHTCNSALTLGRALETLHPIDAILIVDHNSQDVTVRIAREYGANVVQFIAGAAPDSFLEQVSSDWILCIEPRESMTEALAASLYEWKLIERDELSGSYNISLREDTAEGWIDLPEPETRLVPKNWKHWQEHLPAHDPAAKMLEGPLLRFQP